MFPDPDAALYPGLLTRTYVEIALLSILITISFQTSIFFGARFFFRKRNYIFATGVLASLFAFLCSVIKLSYWLTGLTASLSCTKLKILTGLFQGGSNALCFLHLFLRANAIQQMNASWKYWRVLGVCLIIANWSSLLAVAFQRSVTVTLTADGPRCQFLFSALPLEMKFLFQTLNHLAQSAFFIWPLLKHISAMRKQRGAQEGSSIMMGWAGGALQLYEKLVLRAFLAMVFSTVFTATVTAVIYWSRSDASMGPNIVPLTIADNGFTLISIFYANGLTHSGSRKQSSSSSGAAVDEGLIGMDRSERSSSLQQQEHHQHQLHQHSSQRTLTAELDTPASELQSLEEGARASTQTSEAAAAALTSLTGMCLSASFCEAAASGKPPTS